jgi:ubiquinone/menaquinone biosynthesis C-methylase UbiE
MGIYENQVLPRAIDVMLGTKGFGRVVREPTCAGLHGDVIELGFGSGLNLPHYPAAVTSVWTVDPSIVGMRLARKRIATSSVAVHEGGLDGARLDCPDDRFDAGLSTMTLCTIPDAEGALRELRRVLKPGAAFHFAEHGLAPDAKVARFQQRFDPWQQRLAGGCHLARDMRALIGDAGFEIEQLDNRFIQGPKAWSYMYIGRARNPS